MAKILLVEQHINRAFDSNILIGEILKKNGHKVRISQTGVFLKKNVIEFDPDIIYMPWISDSSQAFLKKINYQGKLINAFQEQYLLIDNPNHVHCQQIKDTDIFFGWGKEFIEKAKQINGNIEAYIIGSPRFDSYVDKVVKKMFVRSREELAKTNNIPVHKPWVLIAYDYPFLFDENTQNKLLEKGHTTKEYIRLTAEAFDKLTNWLHKITEKHEDKEFILRLHPGSNERKIKSYQELEDIENITYNNEGGVNQWIINSDYYITRLSTSVVEAWIADKPCGILFKDLLPADRKKDMHIAESKRVINKLTELESFLDIAPSQYKSSKKNHSKFLKKRFGLLDGKASLRSAEKIDQIAKKLIACSSGIKTSTGLKLYLKTTAFLKTFLNQNNLVNKIPTKRPNTEFISEKEIGIRQNYAIKYLSEYLNVRNRE